MLLSPEQEALCDEIVREYDQALKPTEPDMDAIRKWVDIVYGFYNIKPPEKIEIMDSPIAALNRSTELTGTKQIWTDSCGVNNASWVVLHDFYHRIGTITDDEFKDLAALRAFIRCAWDTILMDELALVVRMPTVLERDRDGNLHCETGPAIGWKDGNEEWAWHGVWVPERVITAPRSYTKAEYLEIKDTEVRRALSEAAGGEFIMTLLGAELQNTWTDPKTQLQYELFGAATGEKWLRKQSPRLQNGDQPLYVEPVHEDLKTAQAARKWQATTLSAAECEKDPELEFGQES